MIYRAAGFPLGNEAEREFAHYFFPGAMLKLRLGSLLRLVLLLGSMDEKGRLHGKLMIVDNNLAAATETCRTAVTMLRDWPKPLREKLRSMLPGDTNNPSTLKLNKIFGDFYVRLYQGLPRKDMGLLHDVFEGVLIENWKGFIHASHYRPGYFSTAVVHSSYWVSVHEAEKLAHATARRILDAIRQGHIEATLSTKGVLNYWMIKRESLQRWIAARDLERARYMSLSEIKSTLGLGYRAITILVHSGLVRCLKKYNSLFSRGPHFLREDVTKIIHTFQKHTVTRRKYTGPGKLMTFRDALNCLGHRVLPDLIQAVDDGDLVPVHYAKLSRGISGYIFPFEKLCRYHRGPKILPRRLVNPHPVSGILESARMSRLLRRHELNRIMGPHRRSILKSGSDQRASYASASAT